MIFPCRAATILSSSFTENKNKINDPFWRSLSLQYIHVHAPFAKDGFCVLPESLASVASTFTCSLSSIDTMPGARMKIPLKPLVLSIWVDFVIVPFKALHTC